MLHYSSSELRKVASIASLCSVMSVGFLTSLACAGSGSVAEAPDPEPSDVQAPRPEPAPAPKEPAPAAPSGGDVTLIELAEELRPTSDDPGCPSCFLLGADLATVTTSSTLDPVARYGGSLLLDTDFDTAWCEGAPGSGEGSTVDVRFKSPQPVDRIVVHPGYLKSEKVLFGNARPAVFTLEAGAKTFRIKMPNYPRDYAEARGRGRIFPTVILDGSPIDGIKLTVEEVYLGDGAEDLCISGLGIEVLDL